MDGWILLKSRRESEYTWVCLCVCMRERKRKREKACDVDGSLSDRYPWDSLSLLTSQLFSCSTGETYHSSALGVARKMQGKPSSPSQPSLYSLPMSVHLLSCRSLSCH